MNRRAGLVLLGVIGAAALAEEPAAFNGDGASGWREPRCLVIDVFAAAADEAAGPVTARLEALAAERGGITVVRRFTDAVPEDQAALAAAAAQHGFAATDLPVVLACGSAVPAARDPDAVIRRVEAACSVEVSTRRGFAAPGGRGG